MQKQAIFFNLAQITWTLLRAIWHRIENVDGFCLIFERGLSYVIQPPSLTSSRLCPCQWSVRMALLFNQSSDYPFQHFVDENDEANHTGHYGRISYTPNVSQEPSEGPGITSLLKQKHNWAAVTLHSPPHSFVVTSWGRPVMRQSLALRLSLLYKKINDS